MKTTTLSKKKKKERKKETKPACFIFAFGKVLKMSKSVSISK